MVQVLYVTKAQECSEILHGVPSVFMWLSVMDHGMWRYAQCLTDVTEFIIIKKLHFCDY